MGWVAPAYRAKEGVTLHPVAYKFSLQYEGMCDGCFGVRVGTWNVVSLSGKGGDVCEELRERRIDVCCL